MIIKDENGKKVDVVVYSTLSNKYRAYVCGKPNIQAWGISETAALENLKKRISIK